MAGTAAGGPAGGPEPEAEPTLPPVSVLKRSSSATACSHDLLTCAPGATTLQTLAVASVFEHCNCTHVLFGTNTLAQSTGSE